MLFSNRVMGKIPILSVFDVIIPRRWQILAAQKTYFWETHEEFLKQFIKNNSNASFFTCPELCSTLDRERPVGGQQGGWTVLF